LRGDGCGGGSSSRDWAARIIRRLGSDADRTAVVFITVDPELAALAAVARAYRV
jgi:cytochrome oxidase Cu insertion factor (SCO1/SenC/PrrC family)